MSLVFQRVTSALGGGRGVVAATVGLSALLVWTQGCDRFSGALPDTALLVTQTPSAGTGHEPTLDLLDARYPPGSRIVLVPQLETPDRVVPLSSGLAAAGSPVLGPDGSTVLFVGKASPTNAWQIYRISVRGGKPEALTTLPGGAMDPAWLPAGRFVFSSPVPRLAAETGGVPALFSLALTGGPPAKLTCSLAAATDPTVLADGRVLYVSSVPAGDPARPAAHSLFTINNDGTEVSAYAGQHDGPATLRRPREAADGRVIFLSAGPGTTGADGRIEQVLAARPFNSRSVAFPQIVAPCRSVEPAVGGSLLATLREPGPDRTLHTFAVFRLEPGASSAGSPIFDDPAWDDIEAVSAVRPSRPMGRLSTVDPERRDGLLLCLDANLTERRSSPTAPRGTMARVLRHCAEGPAEVLGDVPLWADGSFMVNVPADVTLSIEVLDAERRLLRRCPPAVWVRPGENRACVGCHEPHNRAPDNRRPLAVRRPPVRLSGAVTDLSKVRTPP